MSVSDRSRDKPSAFAQMLRTFFQSYDEANPPDRIAALRNLPLGSVMAFVTEQALWRTQRQVFGITLLEIRRLLELAKQEMGSLRQSMKGLGGEVEEVRSLLHESS